MAITLLSLHATEQGTYVINVALEDEDGNAVTPTTMSWTLTDKDGNVVNDREDVVVTSPSSSEDIVLSGDDLQITSTLGTLRLFTVKGTYSSSIGTGLPFTGWKWFVIDPSPVLP